jgi:hypothetical protein
MGRDARLVRQIPEGLSGAPAQGLRQGRKPALRYLALALALFSAPAAADLGGTGGLSLNGSREKASGTQGYGAELNVAVAVFNTSVVLRHWDSQITGWNGRQLDDEAVLYAGIGLANLIEIQRGVSNAGVRTRIRIDIGLSENFPFLSDEKWSWRWGRYNKGILVTPFVETGSGKRVYGLAIGVGLY